MLEIGTPLFLRRWLILPLITGKNLCEELEGSWSSYGGINSVRPDREAAVQIIAAKGLISYER